MTKADKIDMINIVKDIFFKLPCEKIFKLKKVEGIKCLRKAL